MPFNFHAEMSFRGMCGSGYFGICVCLRVQKTVCNGRHPRTWYQQQCTCSIME